MPSKMTLFFNQYNAGFSETYYHSQDDPGLLAADTPNSLYQAATNFRHTSVLMKAVRFSRVGGARGSYLIRPSPKAQGQQTTPIDTGPDVVSTTAVYLLSTSSGIRRRVWVRGLADLDVKRDAFGNDLQSASLQNATQAYFGQLKSLGFQVRSVNRPPTAGLTWRNVVSVQHILTTDPNRATFFLQVEAPALNVGDQVSFNGISSSLPHFPRSTTILAKQVVDGITNYTIAYQLPGGVSVSPKALKLTSLTYSQATLYTAAFERFGEHKTGRPFGSLRGRSRAVSLSR